MPREGKAAKAARVREILARLKEICDLADRYGALGY